MKRIILFSFLFAAIFATAMGNMVTETAKKENQTKIQVAILLDTSGSMQGLIEQAKSRLWNIVNTLTTLKYNGKTPKIEISLYEYGSYYRYKGDYIRQITPLTTDLDRISQELFALTTGGSEEYCGTVIHKAADELEWGNNEADMKLIYIAGNEIFDQGEIRYKDAIADAVKKGISVNTIHCGDRATGIHDYWQDAAVRGNGKFFNIDSDERIRYIETPFDAQIILCNDRLNRTYVGYGHAGTARKANQVMQDQNAMSISSANYAERAVSKTKEVYDNTSWDLVDRLKQDKDALAKISRDDLPADLQQLSHDRLQAYADSLAKERAAIQREIARLDAKRKQYMEEQAKEGTGEKKEDLGKAITSSILEFAKAKGYTVE